MGCTLYVWIGPKYKKDLLDTVPWRHTRGKRGGFIKYRLLYMYQPGAAAAASWCVLRLCIIWWPSGIRKNPAVASQVCNRNPENDGTLVDDLIAVLYPLERFGKRT